MDSRHPFSRPQDRPLIHNPNHQQLPPQPQHPTFAGYAPPPASQPPVHVPISDPFTRRDPFLPSSQSQRRSSYGVPARDNYAALSTERGGLAGSWGTPTGTTPLHHHNPHTGAPPPSAISSQSSAPSHVPFAFDAGRRRSVGGGSPPRYYGVPHDPPPPPPPPPPPGPAFGSRQMPPPSSPREQNPLPPYQGQRAPPPPPFSSGRELPGLPSVHRPGSSMSISSLIGGDAPASHPGSHQSPPASAPAASPGTKAMQPPSPRRAHAAATRPEYGPYRTPDAADHYRAGAPSRLAEAAPFSASSPPRSGSAIRSPEQVRPGLSQAGEQHKALGPQPPRLYHSSPTDPYERDSSRPPGAAIPPRPNSQPTALFGPHRDPEQKELADAIMRRVLAPPVADERRRAQEDKSQVRSALFSEAAEQHAPSALGERERPMTVQPVSQSAFSPPKDRTSIQAHAPPMHEASRAPFWRPGKDEPGREQLPREEVPGLLRADGRNAPIAGHSPLPGAAAAREEPSRAARLLDFPGRPHDQFLGGPTSDPSSNDRRMMEQSRQAYLQSLAGRPSAYEPQLRKNGEEMQQQRSFLGVSPDHLRRTGRASPIPQAVQGAQAQLVGPSGDPSIKSEFGKPFAGLGSGLGCAPSGNGTSTPSRLQSPLPQNGADLPARSSEADGPKLVRTGSRAGRRGRPLKDEDGKSDREAADGRRTPSLSSVRASKRPKLNHASHHHHHHPHGHHHHHHHHKPDEESAPTARAASSIAPANGIRFNPSLHPNAVAASAPHHHHHHHPPHHHHHAPKAASSVPVTPPKEPAVRVSTQAVLDSVAHLPRNHLGSMVYEAEVTTAPSESTQLDSRFGWCSQPRPIPPFKGRENCTFTVRVPRYYLSSEQREQMCSRRYLWGTDVYSDDSDPVAAAIHSGWLRGEWPDDVDPSVFLPQSAEEPTEIPEVMLAPLPSGPVAPPADADLHITLLILPTLERYASSVMNGIKSRGWRTHDGVSFKVHKLQWVDEGSASRGLERGIEARKKRLQAAMSLVSLFQGPDARRGQAKEPSRLAEVAA